MIRPITALAAVLLATQAFAQHAGHHHPPEHAAIHDHFYSTWTRPDDRRISCCNLKDCEPVQARRVNGTWFVLRSADMKWLPVPPSRIETERDSPDGRNHACFQQPGMSDTVFCFLPSGAI